MRKTLPLLAAFLLAWPVLARAEEAPASQLIPIHFTDKNNQPHDLWYNSKDIAKMSKQPIPCYELVFKKKTGNSKGGKTIVEVQLQKTSFNYIPSTKQTKGTASNHLFKANQNPSYQIGDQLWGANWESLRNSPNNYFKWSDSFPVSNSVNATEAAAPTAPRPVVAAPDKSVPPPVQKSAPATHSAVSGTLTVQEEWWLTLKEWEAYQADRYSPAAVEKARRQVLANLPAKYKTAYQAARSSREAIKNLFGPILSKGKGPSKIKIYPDTELTQAELLKIDGGKRAQYQTAIAAVKKLEEKYPAFAPDHVRRHQLAVEYNKGGQTAASPPAGSPTPGAGPGAGAPPVPEAPWANGLSEDLLKEFFTSEEIAAYKGAIEKLGGENDTATKTKKDEVVKQTLSKLAAADKKFDKTRVDRLFTLLGPNDFQKHAVCDPLFNQKPQGGVPSTEKITRSIPQVVAAVDNAPGIFGGDVSAASRPHGPATNLTATIPPAARNLAPQATPTSSPVAPKLAAKDSELAMRCNNVFPPESRVAAPSNPPAPAATAAPDPNKWLAVKTGAVGSAAGALIGSFWGFGGAAVGALIAFGVYYWISKLTN
ncbi:MAG: hypothetical protein HY552_06010 [Elusimicrobia bacterium]|nr:hypothetical protein [Elusimicrobiota bacterium]